MPKDKLKIDASEVVKLDVACKQVGIKVNNAVKLGNSAWLEIDFKTGQQLYDAIVLANSITEEELKKTIEIMKQKSNA